MKSFKRVLFLECFRDERTSESPVDKKIISEMQSSREIFYQYNPLRQWHWNGSILSRGVWWVFKIIKANKIESTTNDFSYLCWGPTKANSTEIKGCPNYVIGYDGSLMATKKCLANGVWWKHPESGREWSNYTTCINHSYYNVITQMLCLQEPVLIYHNFNF